jgi:glycine cleavage system protein P-like pyridoxal-binding family
LFSGLVAHEFIINAEFKQTADIDTVDIAKRLQDYGKRCWILTMLIKKTKTKTIFAGNII